MTAPTKTRRQGPVLAALGALAIGGVLIAVVILGSPRSQPTPVAQGSPTPSLVAVASPTVLAPTPIPTSNPLAGALDPTFMAGLGTPGYTFVDTQMPPKPAHSETGLAVHPDGGIYVAVLDSYPAHTMNSDAWLRVVRFTTAGPDPAFDGPHLDRQDDTGSRLIGPLLGAEGVMVVIPNFFSGSIFARYLSNGTPDPTYGPRGLGLAFPNLGAGLEPDVTDAVALEDGSALACALDNLSLVSSSFRLVGMTEAGATASLDPLRIPTCNTIRIDKSNRVVLAGVSDLAVATSFVAFERMSVTRVVDETFGDHGVAMLPVSDTKPLRRGLLAMPDGSLIVGMNVVNAKNAPIAAVIARLTSAGVPDSTFGTAGVLQLTPDGDDCHLSAIATQTDGRIIAATTCSSGPTATSELIRLLPDGTGDPTFGTNGHRAVNEPIAAMVVLPTGELLGVSILDDGRVSLWRRLL
jgi:uncharacterized delta-60 repeat protein